jgi:exosortase
MCQNQQQTGPQLWKWVFGSLALLGAGVYVCADAWSDIWLIAWGDEEASHVLLTPFVIGWLVWTRLEQIGLCRLRISILGPILIAMGAVASHIGFYHSTQALWHGGAILVLAGCLLTVVGPEVLRRFWPAFVVLGFMIPVPGMIRLRLAVPMQDYTTVVTQFVAQLMDMDVLLSGSALWYNDVQVNIAEACNGMRMVFTLLLISFAYAFATPLRSWVRVLLIAASPLTAVACNVIRLVPTLWCYGHRPESTAEAFHDAAGWVMVVVALGLLIGFVRLLDWAQIPVMAVDDPDAHRPTHQHTGREPAVG